MKERPRQGDGSEKVQGGRRKRPRQEAQENKGKEGAMQNVEISDEESYGDEEKGKNKNSCYQTSNSCYQNRCAI